jgi:hypothetical protein
MVGPDIHPECVILIAFPLQQWLRERASMLRCTYITCIFPSLICFQLLYVVLGNVSNAVVFNLGYAYPRGVREDILGGT